jgi:single-strand DNA-binding protein
MAATMNSVFLLGNLGADPEVRTAQNTGKKIANLRLATSDNWTDKETGERKEKTEWHTVVIMDDKASEIVEKYCHKGSTLLIQGKLQTRKWVAKDGTDKYTTEIVVNRYEGKVTIVSAKNATAANAEEADRSDDRTPAKVTAPKAKPAVAQDGDDEIPF